MEWAPGSKINFSATGLSPDGADRLLAEANSYAKLVVTRARREDEEDHLRLWVRAKCEEIYPLPQPRLTPPSPSIAWLHVLFGLVYAAVLLVSAFTLFLLPVGMVALVLLVLPWTQAARTAREWHEDRIEAWWAAHDPHRQHRLSLWYALDNAARAFHALHSEEYYRSLKWEPCAKRPEPMAACTDRQDAGEVSGAEVP